MLGVKPGASEEEVKQAFRSKAKALHPDTAGLNGTTNVDGTGFAELREAYDHVLGRRAVDQAGPYTTVVPFSAQPEPF